MAADVWPGNRGIERQFWFAGLAAHASRIARLAGGRLPAIGLGHEAHAQADCDVGDLPAVLEGSSRPAGKRSGQPIACPWPRSPADGGNAPGPGIVRCGVIGRETRRREREALPAAGPLGRGCGASELRPGAWRRSASAQPLYLLEAERSAARHDGVRFAGPELLRRPPTEHDHALAAAA